MSYATAADVQAIAGRTLSDEETALVERRLAQVERKILRGIPDLAEQITRATSTPRKDGTYSYQFNRETASGRLEILAEEWERLGIKPSRMFSITPNFVAPVRYLSIRTGS